MNATYLRTELIRLVRNRQNFIFTLVFPLILFYAIGGTNRHTEAAPGVNLARFYFAGMVSLGTLAAVTSGGARIAFERQVNWNRQLRLTPLKPQTYFRVKVATSYLMALISLLLLSAAALSVGVHFKVSDWLTTIGLALIALIPFAGLGIMVGHLIKGDAMGPVMGLGTSAFAFLGGAYFPIGQGDGFMHYFVRLIPSYWLSQAGKTGIGGQTWTAEAWIVIAAWAVLAGLGASWAYRRDTKRA